LAASDLIDRSPLLFGRAGDVELLRARAAGTGLTFVAGAAQTGKSWLLMETARQLADAPVGHHLVGFVRSPKGASDPLLRVVVDLYQRWLSDADALRQAKMFWTQQKESLLPTFGRFVAKLSAAAGKIVPGVGELGGTAIAQVLEGLIAASQTLTQGQVILSKLDYDQARDLVGSVVRITGRPVCLVLDQWEETSDIERQARLFGDMLRAIVESTGEWDRCHIFIGAREGGAATGVMELLQADFPGWSRCIQ
jgi:hypothetical protein